MISILICTRNRPHQLKRCLDSLFDTDLGVDKSKYEILIIDNSENESTNQPFVDSFKKLGVKYFYNATAGLSLARNRGLREACGEFVVFLDDDARPHPGWLVEYVQKSEDTNYGVLFGPIEPVWGENLDQPEWIPDDLVGAFTVLDLGNKSRKADSWEYGYGANICFNRNLAVSSGGFDPSLGRVGNALISGEEIDLQDRIRKMGFDSFYCASAKILHHVENERLNPDWLLRRIAYEGLETKQSGLKITELDFYNLITGLSGEEIFKLLMGKDLQKNNVSQIALMRKFLVNNFLTPSNEQLVTHGYDQITSPILCLETERGHTNLIESNFSKDFFSFDVSDVNIWKAGSDLLGNLIQRWIKLTKKENVKSTLLLTLDPWLVPHNFKFLEQFLKSTNCKINVILHRFPVSKDCLLNLNRLIASGVKCFVFSKTLSAQLFKSGIAVVFIEHPQTFDSKFMQSAESKDMKNIGFLGQLRREKLPDLAISSMRLVSQSIPTSRLMMAGALGEDVKKSKFNSKWVYDRTIFESNAFNHKGPSVQDLNSIILECGIGYVFQSGSESMAASGIFQFWINARKPVVAIKGSEVARIVDNFGLGLVADPNPVSVAKAAINILDGGAVFEKQNFDNYLSVSNKSWDRIQREVL